MLGNYPVTAYIPAADVARARRFYEQTLGLRVKEENPVGALYECGSGTQAFLYKSAGAGTNKASTLFWAVADLEAEVADLRKRDIKLEEYDMPGLKTQNGIATGDGVKSAWFKDTEGNILCVAQRL